MLPYHLLPDIERSSFKNNLHKDHKVPVAPEIHGLQSDIVPFPNVMLLRADGMWIYAKQDQCSPTSHDQHHQHHQHQHEEEEEEEEQQQKKLEQQEQQQLPTTLRRSSFKDWQFELRGCSNISSTKVDWRHHAEAPLVSSDLSLTFFLGDSYIVGVSIWWRKYCTSRYGEPYQEQHIYIMYIYTVYIYNTLI